MGGLYDHPTPVELQNRLKLYILGRHSGYVLSEKENTESDANCPTLIDMKDVQCTSEDSTSSLFNEPIYKEEEMFAMSLKNAQNEEIDIIEDYGEGKIKQIVCFDNTHN